MYNIHPIGRSRCFVLDKQFEFARFYIVKTKASVKRLLNMY